MKVLHITGGYPPGLDTVDETRTVPSPAGSAQPKGWNQPFVAAQVSSLQQEGVDCDVWNLGASMVGGRKYQHAARHVRTMARRNYDLIHAHFAYCGWVARLQFRRPVVVSFLGGDVLGKPRPDGVITARERFLAMANRRLAPLVDWSIVKSQEMAAVLPTDRLTIIPNGVDLGRFQPGDRAAARSALGWPEDVPVALFAACPDRPEKRYELAEAAVAVARQSCPALQLRAICGLPPEQVPIYMQAADALLFTSWREGSPNVVKEALACNLPVVSVPVADVPEQLAGVPGCHVVPPDADALATALLASLNGRTRAGRQHLIERGLGADAVARRVIAVYEQVLSRRR